jgi:2-dehydropantoate 2-reductase
VKSHQTDAVARTAARCLLPGSLLLTLQNGIGNRETLEAAAGEGRVAHGLASLGAVVVGPGEVRVAPGGLLLGSEPWTSAAVAAASDLFRESRLETETTTDLDRHVWTRLVLACALEPLSALTSRPYGALLETPEPCDTLVRAAREVAAVAEAKGISFAGDPASLAAQTARTAASAHSPMFHDLGRGALTEIDALCGAVVREGRSLRVPTPMNEYLWHRLREKEGRPLPAAPSAPA